MGGGVKKIPSNSKTKRDIQTGKSSRKLIKNRVETVSFMFLALVKIVASRGQKWSNSRVFIIDKHRFGKPAFSHELLHIARGRVNLEMNIRKKI